MIEQFQNLLESPKHNQQDVLKRTQDLILNALQSMFPPEYDFSDLATIYDKKQITNSQPLLTFHLVDYFIQLVSANFISIHSYSSLQSQTQKLQSTIRSHIKIQQEVKMYLEHLEHKISKYQTYINHFIQQKQRECHERDYYQEPSTQRQTLLMKERLSLIRKNEHLRRKLMEKEDQLRKINQLNSSQIEITHNFMQKDKLKLSKSEQKISHMRMYSDSKSNQDARMEHPLLAKLKTPTQQREVDKSITISINGNHNQFNYYTKP